MISIRKSILIAFLMVFSGGLLLAQDNKGDEKKEDVKKERPRVVRNAFGGSVLLEHQTVLVPRKKTLVLNMQHRFGKLWGGNGFDLLGLYASANIRLGFEYSIFDQLQIGFGTEKNHLAQDLNIKWSILQQRKGTMPIFLTVYSNMAIEAGKKDNYLKDASNPDSYNVGYRFSYYHELMIARKFHKRFSLQISASYSHFNIVNNLEYVDAETGDTLKHDAKHDNFMISALARIKCTPQTSVVLGYDQTLTPPKNDLQLNYPYNLSVGVEIATSAHAFQVFVCNRNGILGQYNMAQNGYDITKGDFLIGFNITRLWGF